MGKSKASENPDSACPIPWLLVDWWNCIKLFQYYLIYVTLKLLWHRWMWLVHVFHYNSAANKKLTINRHV